MRLGTLCPDLQQLQPWRLHLDRIPLLGPGGKQLAHYHMAWLSINPACLPWPGLPSALAVSCRNVWHKKDPSLMGPRCLKASPMVRGRACLIPRQTPGCVTTPSITRCSDLSSPSPIARGASSCVHGIIESQTDFILNVPKEHVAVSNTTMTRILRLSGRDRLWGS